MDEPPKEPVKYIDAEVRLPYHYVAGDYRARYLRALKDKKILGSKCSKTGKVFVMPVVASPESFAPCDELVEISDRGVVTAAAIVHEAVEGLHPARAPFAFVLVKLDGADTALPHVVTDGLERLRVGTRVEAVWKPDGERIGSIRDIAGFRPID